MENSPVFATVSEYARLRGIAEATIREKIDLGEIETKKNGNRKVLKVEDADAYFEKSLDPFRSRIPKRGSMGKKAAAANLIGSQPEKVEFKTLADWKIAKEKWASKKAELEFKIKSGAYVEAEVVKKVAFETGKIIRDNFQSMPDRLSHELAAETDPKKVSLMLESEISKCLEELNSVAKKFKNREENETNDQASSDGEE